MEHSMEVEFCQHLYRELLKIRLTEERIIELYKEGHIKAPVHLSIGQKAIAVGVMSVLGPEDKIFSTHRCHGHYLAKGGSLPKLMAELMGKSGGVARGRGGTMHLFDDEVGHVVSVPLVAASIPFAVGSALAARLKGESRIAVAFFGDGAVEEGVFWESLNFASVHHLPVLFVCENNFYATHSPILKRQPSLEITPRVEPHGVRTIRLSDGNDVRRVREATQIAVKEVRQGQPWFIEACTYRLKEHWGVGEDWDLGYRSREEGEYWRERDPVKRMKDYLLELGVPDSELEAIREALKEEIDAAVAFAHASPAPATLKLSEEKL